MPTTTTTYSFNKPVVGADEDDWGGYLNGNWDSVDDLLDGTTPVTGIDINSGTLDGVTIGGTTAGAGTFTTLTANTSITGTLATAAQTNITSVGTLTSLDVGGTVTADGLTVDAATSIFQNSSGSADVVLDRSANNFGATLQYKTGGSLKWYHGLRGLINDNFYIFNNTASGNSFSIDTNNDISFYEDTGTTAKFFWDASAESLGIGTTSPAFVGGGNPELTISGTVSYFNLQGNRTAGAGNTTGQIRSFNSSTEISRIATVLDSGTTDGAMLFSTASSGSLTERMRIDSSGNLLVGTTDDTPYNNSAGTSADRGIVLSNSGWLAVARDGQPTAYFNRTQSDGGIIDLRKDGTTVGSIGSVVGSYLSIGQGDTGILFQDDNDFIEPCNVSTSSGRDAAISLGTAGGRFKDLYLSGGVYLGGTGAANKLDDYEEGTFQATLSAPTSGTITIQSTADTLAYTKVGRLVTITGMVSIVSTGSAVGDFVLLNNLPFTSADLSEFAGRNGGAVTYNDNSAGTKTSIGTLMLESSTQLRLYVDASSVGGSDDFYVSFSYTTT